MVLIRKTIEGRNHLWAQNGILDRAADAIGIRL